MTISKNHILSWHTQKNLRRPSGAMCIFSRKQKKSIALCEEYVTFTGYNKRLFIERNYFNRGMLEYCNIYWDLNEEGHMRKKDQISS